MNNLVLRNRWDIKFNIMLAVVTLSGLCLVISWGIELLAEVLFRYW